MRVIHIISGDMFAGAEIQAYSLICELIKRTDIVLQVITFNDSILSSMVAKAGVSVAVIDEVKYSSLNIIQQCQKIISEFRPDIIHTHGFKENFIGGMIAIFYRAKVVRTHHGKAMIGDSWRHYIIEKINSSLTDIIISVSQDLKEFLINFGIPSKKINVIHNGINIVSDSNRKEVDLLREQLCIGKDSFVIGTIGRLVPVKNHKTLLEAAANILKRKSDFFLVLVGDGPLLNKLRLTSVRLHIADKVRFIGFRRDINTCLGLFDLFVLPSMHEGVPLALLEAMSTKKPVVATQVGGIPEVVEHGINGLLVPAKDPVLLADACISMMGNKELRKRLSNYAYQTIMKNFSLGLATTMTIKLYQQC